MKGFLQRLASTVVQPRPTVHPFVESIYSGATTAIHETPQIREESILATTSQPAGNRTAPAVVGSPTRVAPAAPRDHSAAGPFAFEPLLPAQTPRAAHDKLPPKAGESRADSHPSAGQHPDIPIQLHLSEPSREPQPEYIPIVLNAFPETASPDAPDSPQPRTSNESYAAQSRQFRPTQPANAARAPQSLPDEVQIHIGRIEVIAVSPPAPRPAAAPARKGLSLDEYLSRGNGRAQ